MEFRELDKKHLDKVSEIFVKAFNSPPWSEEWTKESAYAEIFLNTCRSNKTIGFYEKQGFKVSESIIVMNKAV